MFKRKTQNPRSAPPSAESVGRRAVAPLHAVCAEIGVASAVRYGFGEAFGQICAMLSVGFAIAHAVVHLGQRRKRRFIGGIAMVVSLIGIFIVALTTISSSHSLRTVFYGNRCVFS